VGNEIKILPNINIGLAIAVKDEIIVPVVDNPHKLYLDDINRKVENLIRKANENRLSIKEVTGGNFTLTNLGMFGIEAFTPIITLGQAAILGVGKISEKPMVTNHHIEIRKAVTLSLSFDHRIVDGATAAKFLGKIEQLLEQPKNSA
jgi:pyruvate dehydrogenase E2 component (dihydrolipoamide acetyltransferase)